MFPQRRGGEPRQEQPRGGDGARQHGLHDRQRPHRPSEERGQAAGRPARGGRQRQPDGEDRARALRHGGQRQGRRVRHGLDGHERAEPSARQQLHAATRLARRHAVNHFTLFSNLQIPWKAASRRARRPTISTTRRRAWPIPRRSSCLLRARRAGRRGTRRQQRHELQQQLPARRHDRDGHTQILRSTTRYVFTNPRPTPIVETAAT